MIQYWPPLVVVNDIVIVTDDVDGSGWLFWGYIPDLTKI